MSEENKNRNKDKGKQKNNIKYDPKAKYDVEFSQKTEALDLSQSRHKKE